MGSIVEALYGTTGKDLKKLLGQLGRDYEHIALSSEELPDECVDLVCEILATEELFTKPGIDIFLLKISTDMHRLSEQQKLKLLRAITENYERYSKLEMCWRLGDLIARSYDRTVALDVFRSLFRKASDQGKEGLALGMDILVRQSKQDPQLIKQIDKIVRG